MREHLQGSQVSAVELLRRGCMHACHLSRLPVLVVLQRLHLSQKEHT